MDMSWLIRVVLGFIITVSYSAAQQSLIGFGVLEAKCSSPDEISQDHASSIDDCADSCYNVSNCKFLSYGNDQICRLYSECTLVSTSAVLYMRLDGYIETQDQICEGTIITANDVSAFADTLNACLIGCTNHPSCAAVNFSPTPVCELVAYENCTQLVANDTMDVYRRIYCPDPEVRNGIIELAGSTVDDISTYRCLLNYFDGGAPTIKCIQDGRSENAVWDGPGLCTYGNYFDCGITCFQQPADGTYHMECRSGFEIFVIWANYGWDSTFECGTPVANNEACLNISINDDIKTRCNGMTECDITVDFEHSCPSGTTPYLQGEYKCVQNLNTANEICQPHPDCYSVNISNGETDMIYGKEQSSINFTCNTGYEMVGSSPVNCLDNGTLESDMPSCSVVECPPLETPANGTLSTTDTVYLTNVTFLCNDGFEAIPSTAKVCGANGEWEPAETINCEIKTCPVLNIENGEPSTGATDYLTTVGYSCNEGYNKINSAEKTCEASGEWSASEDFSCSIIHCPALTLENGELSTGETKYLTVVNYSCNEGYDKVNSAEKSCQASGEWSASEDFNCSIKHCSVLNVEYGELSTGETEYLTTVSYSCNEGYDKVNSAEKTCEASGEWSASEDFSCSIKHCPVLNVENGELSTGATEYLTNVSYSCNEGYNKINSAERTCEASGEWSASEDFSCSIILCPGLTLENGELSTGETKYLTVVNYSCNEGYEKVNSAEKSCQASGEWSASEDFNCSIVHCPELTVPENGQLSTSETEYLTNVTYICNTGYEASAGQSKVCMASQEWQPAEAVTCEIINCPALEALEHGQISTTDRQYQTEVTYTCETGYELSTDEDTKVCQANAQWDPAEDILCLFIDCHDPPEAPANGNMQVNTTTYGSVVIYSCETGYLLQGNTSIRCLSDGNWIGDSPYCQVLERNTVVANLQTSLDCDDFSVSSLQELLQLNLATLKDFISSRIENLPDDAKHLVVVTVVGISCNSPLSFVVEVELGNLLSTEETMDHLRTVTSSLVGSTVSLQDASGSSIAVNIQGSEVSENKEYQCGLGYYLDTESGNCLPCPKHTYQPTAIQGLCWSCPRGTYTEGDATYGEEAAVCLTVKSQGATALIGVGIGIPVGFIALLFVVLGFHAAMKSSKTKKDLEQYSVRRSHFSTKPDDYYSHPYVSGGRRYNPFHK